LRALDNEADAAAAGAPAPTGDHGVASDATVAAREIAWPLADGIAVGLDDPDRQTRALTLRVLAKLGDERLTPARLADAVADGAPVLADAALSATQILLRTHPDLAAPIAGAVAPLVSASRSATSWGGRLAAVQLLAMLGPPGLPALDRAMDDPNAVVRAAALAAVNRARSSGPRPPG